MKKILNLFLLLPTLLSAHEGVDHTGMMNGIGMMQNGFWSILIWILFTFFIIAILFFIIKPKKDASCCGPDASALDILKGRYARGEISKEEFEETKKNLH